MAESQKLPLWRMLLLVVVALGTLYYLDHRFETNLFQALFGHGGGRTMSEGSDEGEERPPVVVSSGGSIRFEAQDYGSGHGMFSDDGVTGQERRQIRHEGAKVKGPQRLALLFVNSTCRTDGADHAPNYVFNLKPGSSLAIEYTDGHDPHHLTVLLTGRILRFKSDEDEFLPHSTAASANNYTRYLWQGQPWHLSGATFVANLADDYEHDPPDNKAVQCALTEGSSLVVFQRAR